MATFRKRGDKWEYRVSFKDPFTLKYKIKSKSGFKTKKEAQKAAAEQEKLIASGLEFDNAPLTLEQFLMSWLQEYKKGTVRKNTYQLHERNIKNHILPYFKNVKVTDVKPIMYQKFLNHLTDQGYSKRTVEIIHGTMFNAFNKAVIIGKLEKNPCYGATIANKKKKKKESLEYMISTTYRGFYKKPISTTIFIIFFSEHSLKQVCVKAKQLHSNGQISTYETIILTLIIHWISQQKLMKNYLGIQKHTIQSEEFQSALPFLQLYKNIRSGSLRINKCCKKNINMT